jgi:hypothetical protein
LVMGCQWVGALSVAAGVGRLVLGQNDPGDR